MTKTSGTRVTGALFVVGVTALLSSCYMDPPFVTNPVSLQRTGDELTFVLCEDTAIDSVTVEVRRFPAGWTTVYKSTGDATIEAESPQTTGVPLPEQTIVAHTHVNLDEAVDVSIWMSSPEDEVEASLTHFSLWGRDFPTDSWLHWDGEVTAKPCTG